MLTPSPTVELPAPTYRPSRRTWPRFFLGVESMRRHMTDEGWQLMAGLSDAGYQMCGHGLENDETDVATLLQYDPAVVVLQDKREWDVRKGDFRDEKARFHNYQRLVERADVFKVTVLKDAHQRPAYHRESAAEIGCHAWIVYYHPRIVKHLAPYVRYEHLIRTYHTIDANSVPPYSPRKTGCLLSGALSGAYPLRTRLARSCTLLPGTTLMPHPGYHRNGTQTPAFLAALSRYKVAICTASVYGYALRKLIEATACGCRVITDLPEGDPLPLIDGNLIRVSPNVSLIEIKRILRNCYESYDPELQEHYAALAKSRYDYHTEGQRLAASLEEMRCAYRS